MKNIDFTVDKNDLKCLFIACKINGSFNSFIKECEQAYIEYHERNLNNMQKYGKPKTFSQWINAQIRYLP